MPIDMNERAQFLGDIINVFEDFLEEKGIDIPNDEKLESENPAIIYGTDYGDIQSRLEVLLERWGALAREDEE